MRTEPILLCQASTDKLPRIESGPVQIDDDWPGFFMRGDNAIHAAHILRRAANMLRQVTPRESLASLEFFTIGYLDGLAENLMSVVIEPTPE